MNLEVLIDKIRVRQAFSRQAHIYEEKASLQKEVAKKLISLILLQRQTPNSELRTLDIGIGTGFATREFLTRFPDSGLFGCDIASGMLREAGKTGAKLAVADAEELPFKDNTFDMIFSSLAFQWTNLYDSINEAFRVLMPHGRFYFSTFGERTLGELADSYNSALRMMNGGRAAGTMKFEASGKIMNVMESAGFKDVKVEADVVNDSYPSPEALLRSLKAIGAGNPSREFHASRTLLNDTFRIYRERYGEKGSIPATFEIYYVQGVKG